jgi:predicted MFS family arabinose efflux permease
MLFTIFLATPPAGPLAEYFSRRRVTSFGGMLYGVGMILCACAPGVGMFLAGRLVAGAGQGLFFSTSAIWQVESAPKEVRVPSLGVPGLAYQR